MLGKLLKHELKETASRLIPLNVILITFTAIGCIMIGTRLFHQKTLSVLGISYITLYILSIFALFIITGVYLTIRFYKTMYSNQGYLTHTLPVSTGAILNTKVLVSSFWVAAASVISMLSIFSLVRTAAGDDWQSIDIPEAISMAFGIGYGEFLLYVIPILIFACFSSVLMIFASLSIGQLFSQHRILGAVGAFIGIYTIQQIVGTVIIFILGFQNMIFESPEETEIIPYSGFYQGIFRSSLLEMIFFAIVFYGICYFLTKKKLNLE